MDFLSYLIAGTGLGSIYAIMALGYTMVYGIAKMLNFAHGDIIMIGSYIIFYAVGNFGMNPYLSILLSMVLCTALGMLIERIAYKPLRDAAPLAVLITAIGMSYLLQNIALLSFGADTKAFPDVFKLPAIRLAGGELVIPGITVLTIVLCIIIILGLEFFVNKTKHGIAMLAVSEDRDAAALMGINVNGTIAMTFAIGSGLAAIAGVLFCSRYQALNPYTGAIPGIKAFTAAVFGGIGSIPGAFIGGLVLGIIESLSGAYISSELANAIVFGVLIVVLIVKPAGIMGKEVQEKV